MKIKDCCDFFRGLTYQKKDEVPLSSRIVLRANNIDLQTGKLIFSDLKYINEKIPVPTEKIIKRDDILICTASGSKSHLGKVALIDQDYGYAFGGFMGVLRARPCVFSEYLYVVLTSPQFKSFLSRLTDGTNINNLKFADIEDFDFLLPSISEQKRIVGVLDAAFEKIDAVKRNAERNLANAKELFQRTLDEEMTPKRGWRQVAVKNLHTTLTPPNKIHSSKYKSTGLFPIVSQDAQPINGYWDNENDLIHLNGKSVVIFGDHTKVVKYVNFDFVQGADGVKILLPNQAVLPRFFYYGVRHTPLRNLGYARHYKLLKEAVMAFPSLDKQKQIVETLDATSAKINAVRCNVKNAEIECAELKQQILSKAFNGEL